MTEKARDSSMWNPRERRTKEKETCDKTVKKLSRIPGFISP
jgi:hypothetical protein